MSSSLCELVVDRADDPTSKKAQHKCITKADDAAKESDPVAGKKVGEQTQMCADVLAAFQYQKIGGQEQAGSHQNAKEEPERMGVQNKDILCKRCEYTTH